MHDLHDTGRFVTNGQAVQQPPHFFDTDFVTFDRVLKAIMLLLQVSPRAILPLPNAGL
jgi:hypothetical protein